MSGFLAHSVFWQTNWKNKNSQTFLLAFAAGLKSYGDDMHVLAISSYHLGVLLIVLGKSGNKLLQLVINISTWLSFDSLHL